MALRGKIHVWEEDRGWYWDDAEDPGGSDRNVPCGPFADRDEAIRDAEQCFRHSVTVSEGKPTRYEADDGYPRNKRRLKCDLTDGMSNRCGVQPEGRSDVGRRMQQFTGLAGRK